MNDIGDTLGMEGHVIERRTSSVQSWGDARQSTMPSTSTTTPTGVPSYSNIFVTPPKLEVELRKSPDETSAAVAGGSALVRDGKTRRIRKFAK